jgi:hypothetical protein
MGEMKKGQLEHLGWERGEPTQHMQPTKHHETDSNYAAHLLMLSTKHGVKSEMVRQAWLVLSMGLR